MERKRRKLSHINLPAQSQCHRMGQTCPVFPPVSHWHSSLCAMFIFPFIILTVIECLKEKNIWLTRSLYSKPNFSLKAVRVCSNPKLAIRFRVWVSTTPNPLPPKKVCENQEGKIPIRAENIMQKIPWEHLQPARQPPDIVGSGRVC